MTKRKPAPNPSPASNDIPFKWLVVLILGLAAFTALLTLALLAHGV